MYQNAAPAESGPVEAGAAKPKARGGKDVVDAEFEDAPPGP